MKRSETPEQPSAAQAVAFNQGETILVTGAAGFIGPSVVASILARGAEKVRCLVRPTSHLARLSELQLAHPGKLEIVVGDLLSREDCQRVAAGASVVYHLAATSGKSFPAVFMNCVVATRNLLDAVLGGGTLRRFVNVSSFAVYSNEAIRRGGVLDETCALERPPQRRGEAYCYAKLKQDELVEGYGRSRNLRFVTVRPGAVYGPGKIGLSGRIGVGTFGPFVHIGGSNQLPMTYVDNCAEAIVLAGLTPRVEGQVFNVVDDDPLTSREFLRAYKKSIGSFRSIRMPYPLAYLLSFAWEKYSTWSEGQLPPAFNRSRCMAEWKGNTYDNSKLKSMGWRMVVSRDEGMRRFLAYQSSVKEVA